MSPPTSASGEGAEHRAVGIFHDVHVRRPATCARTRLDDAGCRAPSTEEAEEEKAHRRPPPPMLSERRAPEQRASPLRTAPFRDRRKKELSER
ncbi:hypothetical protein MTO96_000930 [Rhipicephalus appendiculatus]